MAGEGKVMEGLDLMSAYGLPEAEDFYHVALQVCVCVCVCVCVRARACAEIQSAVVRVIHPSHLSESSIRVNHPSHLSESSFESSIRVIHPCLSHWIGPAARASPPSGDGRGCHGL